jgi:hypothetical protein
VGSKKTQDVHARCVRPLSAFRSQRNEKNSFSPGSRSFTRLPQLQYRASTSANFWPAAALGNRFWAEAIGEGCESAVPEKRRGAGWIASVACN